ncbi:MAG: DUF3793 family protein [Phascolarctobacterium sp.]|nr:DUF3793 family protein [Phascolarctobacterium sp.]
MELLGFRNFDELLAFHCSPVLIGIKPANLISLPNGKHGEINSLLHVYNSQFRERGLISRKRCGCSRRNLLLMYNEEKLQQLLKKEGYRAYLIAAGYKNDGRLEDDLEKLEQRLQEAEKFPHEIGVFLGYPLEDILGFVLHKGHDYKYTGYWKVYGDVKQARKVFAAYESYRDFLVRKVAEGIPLYEAVSVI